jgi:hypothetical protein
MLSRSVSWWLQTPCWQKNDSSRGVKLIPAKKNQLLRQPRIEQPDICGKSRTESTRMTGECINHPMAIKSTSRVTVVEMASRASTF